MSEPPPEVTLPTSWLRWPTAAAERWSSEFTTHGWLPHAYIQAVSYAGERTDADYQTDARDIGGPLDQQVAESLHFVRRNMLVRAAKETARSELPQFSERAVFEALVNAVAHRDYSMSGARVRLHLFGDRLELYVPGRSGTVLRSSQ